ncbi:MAG: TonB-dependent receptor [Opitutaceae bacterium]|nr:TonB-dependent receptor [Opitutaceae bacterium]
MNSRLAGGLSSRAVCGCVPAWRAAFCLSLLVVAATAAEPARAAKLPTEDEVVSLQNFVVTGSNIKRLDMEKVAPVTVLDQDAMTVRQALLPVDMLTSLPSVVNLPENETRLGSSGARGDNANINLRNLGATATLILVNGRRMAINPMTAGLSQAVNVNQLPTQGIERIEVLRDGASSIYGSDAVGGVINYVLKRQFQGAEATLRFAQPEHGAGQSVQGTFTFGTSFAQGRGRLFGTIETLYREAIFLRDRDFSKTSFLSAQAPAPFNNPGGPFDARTARGRWPIFRIGTATASNWFRPVNGTPVLTTAAPNFAANPEFYLDLNQFGMAAPRMARASTFVSGELDVTKRITAFADFSYYKAESTMVRQPLALNAPTSDKLAVLPIDNPYNPYGSRFYSATGAPNADGAARLTGAPREISIVSVTLPDLGVEKVSTKADVVRAAAGFRGKLGDNWSWESSAFYNRVQGKDDAFPDVRESLLAAALRRTDATAYNPFGYTFRVQGNAVVADRPYTNPAATVSSFASVYSRNATSSIASGDLRVTGRLFRWWGGDIQTSFGTEYRSDRLADKRPPFSGENPPGAGLDTTDNDYLLHPPRPDVIGDRQIASFYAELVVPLVPAEKRVPLVNTLELTASGRNERYSDFGNTTKPKVGLNWRPASWLMLRGSYNEGFMAPSLAALFTSPRWSISAGAGDIDTYRNPLTNEGAYVQRTYFGGNPALKPQESKGKTYGIVLDVPGIKGLSVTADQWRIERTNLLGQRSTGQIRDSDAALIRAYTRAQLAAGRTIAQIDLGSGTPNYKGDPDVVRYAVTPEDIAAFAPYNNANPGNQQGIVGKVFSVNQPFINVAESLHEGVDLGLRYVVPRFPWGNVVFNSDWSYFVRSRSITRPANVAAIEVDDMNTSGVARWRGTSNVSWRRGAWSGNLGAYYVGPTQGGASTTQAIWESLGRPGYISRQFTGGQFVYRYVVNSTITYNASLGYRFGPDAAKWLRGTRVRVGVANLFDKEPPLTTGAFGYDPGVSQGLLPGRTWSIEFGRQF